MNRRNHISQSKYWQMLPGIRFRYEGETTWRRHEAGQEVNHQRPLILDTDDDATLGCLQKIADDAVYPDRVVLAPVEDGWIATVVARCDHGCPWHPTYIVNGGKWCEALGGLVLHPSRGHALCASIWASTNTSECDA